MITVLLHVILTIATLCSVASQTLCLSPVQTCNLLPKQATSCWQRVACVDGALGASSRCRTRQRDSSPALVVVTPHHTSVEATPLPSRPTTSRFQDGPPGLQGAARFNCSVSCRRLPARLTGRPSPATIGRHRHVLCATDQHAVQRPEFHSRWTTALEQSPGQESPARQWHRRISSAAKVVFVSVTLRRIVTSCFYAPCKYSYSLIHSLTSGVICSVSDLLR